MSQTAKKTNTSTINDPKDVRSYTTFNYDEVKNDEYSGTVETNIPRVPVWKLTLWASFWFSITVFLIIGFFAFFQMQYRSDEIVSGTRIQIKSADGKFIRVDKGQRNTLVASEPIPWILSSTFEVYVNPDKSWQLFSLNGFWVSVHDKSGNIRADQASQVLATRFVPTKHFPGHPVSLAIVGTDAVLALADLHIIPSATPTKAPTTTSSSTPTSASTSIPTNSTVNPTVINTTPPPSSTGYDLQDTHDPTTPPSVATSEFVENTNFDTTYHPTYQPTVAATTTSTTTSTASSSSYSTPDPSDPATPSPDITRTLIATASSAAAFPVPTSLHTDFHIIVVPRLRGVNLGGWFIPEVWMLPSFYNGTGLGWGGSLCSIVDYSRELAEERMAHQLENWFTEEDFKRMAAIGLNSVRLPIGYWNVMEDPYQRYAPLNLDVSLHYIDWAFDMAAKYKLSVLLDLHGAPGSQNGIDHSGCGGSVIKWYPQWKFDNNRNLTLQAIEAMAKRYSGRDNLLGFELLNEPNHDLERWDHDMLLAFYESSYAIVRKYSPTALVVFNELYEEFYATWKGQLREPEFYNVVVDWHLYDWQANHTYEKRPEHIQHAEAWGAQIEAFTPNHPIIVGEWSFSTGTEIQAGQEFVTDCQESFDRSLGWYVWNWKLEGGLGFDTWDLLSNYNRPDGFRLDLSSKY